MAEPANLSPAIIEALYAEALRLADKARDAFDVSGKAFARERDEDLARITLSCEALRTTTRMMHAIAWLLNQKAHLAGELSEFQLRRHGRLPPAQPDSETGQLELLDPAVAALIERTRSFYARIERIDAAWRSSFAMQPAAIHRLRERLGQAVAAL